MYSFIFPRHGELNQNQFLKLVFNKNKKTWLESILIQVNHPKHPYASSLSLVTDHFKYLSVKDLIAYWQEKSWLEIENQITEYNWMYVACIHFSFIRIDEPTDINIYADKIKRTGKEAIARLKLKPLLSPKQIEKLIEDDPIIIKGSTIINGFHRVFCMIGRIIQKKSYIPISYKHI